MRCEMEGIIKNLNKDNLLLSIRNLQNIEGEIKTELASPIEKQKGYVSYDNIKGLLESIRFLCVGNDTQFKGVFGKSDGDTKYTSILSYIKNLKAFNEIAPSEDMKVKVEELSLPQLEISEQTNRTALINEVSKFLPVAGDILKYNCDFESGKVKEEIDAILNETDNNKKAELISNLVVAYNDISNVWQKCFDAYNSPVTLNTPGVIVITSRKALLKDYEDYKKAINHNEFTFTEFVKNYNGYKNVLDKVVRKIEIKDGGAIVKNSKSKTFTKNPNQNQTVEENNTQLIAVNKQIKTLEKKLDKLKTAYTTIEDSNNQGLVLGDIKSNKWASLISDKVKIYNKELESIKSLQKILDNKKGILDDKNIDLVTATKLYTGEQLTRYVNLVGKYINEKDFYHSITSKEEIVELKKMAEAGSKFEIIDDMLKGNEEINKYLNKINSQIDKENPASLYNKLFGDEASYNGVVNTKGLRKNLEEIGDLLKAVTEPNADFDKCCKDLELKLNDQANKSMALHSLQSVENYNNDRTEYKKKCAEERKVIEEKTKQSNLSDPLETIKKTPILKELKQNIDKYNDEVNEFINTNNQNYFKLINDIRKVKTLEDIEKLEKGIYKFKEVKFRPEGEFKTKAQEISKFKEVTEELNKQYANDAKHDEIAIALNYLSNEINNQKDPLKRKEWMDSQLDGGLDYSISFITNNENLKERIKELRKNLEKIPSGDQKTDNAVETVNLLLGSDEENLENKEKIDNVTIATTTALVPYGFFNSDIKKEENNNPSDESLDVTSKKLEEFLNTGNNRKIIENNNVNLEDLLKFISESNETRHNLLEENEKLKLQKEEYQGLLKDKEELNKLNNKTISSLMQEINELKKNQGSNSNNNDLNEESETKTKILEKVVQNNNSIKSLDKKIDELNKEKVDIIGSLNSRVSKIVSEPNDEESLNDIKNVTAVYKNNIDSTNALYEEKKKLLEENNDLLASYLAGKTENEQPEKNNVSTETPTGNPNAVVQTNEPSENPNPDVPVVNKTKVESEQPKEVNESPYKMKGYLLVDDNQLVADTHKCDIEEWIKNNPDKCDKIKSIVVDKGSVIKSNVLNNFVNAETVKLNRGVLGIDSESFKDMPNLKSVYINDDVKKDENGNSIMAIHPDAFNGINSKADVKHANMGAESKFYKISSPEEFMQYYNGTLLSNKLNPKKDKVEEEQRKLVEKTIKRNKKELKKVNKLALLPKSRTGSLFHWIARKPVLSAFMMTSVGLLGYMGVTRAFFPGAFTALTGVLGTVGGSVAVIAGATLLLATGIKQLAKRFSKRYRNMFYDAKIEKLSRKAVRKMRTGENYMNLAYEQKAEELHAYDEMLQGERSYGSTKAILKKRDKVYRKTLGKGKKKYKSTDKLIKKLDKIAEKREILQSQISLKKQNDNLRSEDTLKDVKGYIKSVKNERQNANVMQELIEGRKKGEKTDKNAEKTNVLNGSVYKTFIANKKAQEAQANDVANSVEAYDNIPSFEEENKPEVVTMSNRIKFGLEELTKKVNKLENAKTETPIENDINMGK